MNKTVFLIGSSEVSIYNFRKELVYRLLDEGFKVIVASPYGSRFQMLIDVGCTFIDTPMQRRSKNFIRDFVLIKSYKDIIKKYKPDIVITYTIKPNIYGGLASFVTNTPYVMNITGLGTELENGGISSSAITFCLRPLMCRSRCVFFQNSSHLQLFEKKRIVKDNTKLVLGSGVNLEEHRVLPYDDHGDEVHILYLGRIMQAKGIRELIEGTKIAQAKNPKIKVSVLGFVESGYKDTFAELNADNTVEKLDYTDNVDAVIARFDAVINPSYHEGLSNSLLEGAACVRPLLASNVTGCFETVDDGETGFLFNVKDAEDLADKLLKLASLTVEERREMGLRGRRKMEEQFDRNQVVESYMQEIYKVLEIQPQEVKQYAESVSVDGDI